MPPAASAAFATVLMMAVCVLISFGGVYWVLTSWFERRIRGWEAFLLLVALLAVMYFAIILVMHGNVLGMALPLGALVVGLVGRCLVEWADQKQYDQFDEEDVARYQAAIEMDPRNVAAHSFLAESWRRMGKLDEAIREYRAALALDPSLKEEKYWLERCRLQLEHQGRPPEIACPTCHLPHTRGQSACPQCGRVYSTLEVWAHTFRLMSPAQRLLWSLVGAAAITLVLAVAALLPGAGVLLVILGMLAFSIMTLVVSYRDRRRGRSAGP